VQVTASPLLPVSLTVALLSCGGATTAKPSSSYSDLDDDGLAWAAVDDLGAHAAGLATDGSTTWALVDGAVLASSDLGRSWAAVPTTGLPDARLLWVGVAGGTLLVEADGEGILRWSGGSWQAPTTPPSSTFVAAFNPRLRPVPYGASGSSDGWLATAGGLFHTTDSGDTWSEVSMGADAGFNLLFTGVARAGDTVYAGAFLPAGLLPAQYADLLSGALFRSDDGGSTWADAAPDLPFRYASGVAIDAEDTPWVATLDGGLHTLIDQQWSALGGPTDAVAVSLPTLGEGVNVLSTSRGVWRRTDQGWQGAGDTPMVGLTADLALAEDGTLYRLDAHDTDDGANQGDANVHIALSFHVNLYHSYRGDSNDDDGYGLDLDVIRTTLDWLDDHPEVRADWDIENYFSLGEWMQTDGADVLARLQARVDAGTDHVRPMSWNNGAMANHTETEFKVSMTRARDGLDAVFGSHVPGVQPQECMLTADHIGWYSDVGIEWLTLFYSGTPFTALRFDHNLPKTAWYNPFSLTNSDGDALTTVPVYHHADLINHGGLGGWASQIHEGHSDDQLLVIHFDADSETWEAFEAELTAAEALPFVTFTTIDDYVADHTPTASIQLVGDTADGTGDGFQSWAEKDFNHRLATRIHQARELAVRAEHLASDLDDDARAELDAHLAAAFDARLLALSTTHFGLAAPTLHADRIASAWGFADTAITEAQAALQFAEQGSEVSAGEIRVDNPHDESGAVLLDFTLDVPADRFSSGGLSAIWVAREDVPLAVEMSVLDESSDPIEVRARLPLEVAAYARVDLTWGIDGGHAIVVGDAVAEAIFTALPVETPFTECAGEQTVATHPTADAPTVDARQVVATDTRVWDLSFCGVPGPSSLTWTAERVSGLPGVIWTVAADLPDATDGTATEDAPWNLDAESVVLSPLLCPGEATQLDWRAMSGTTRTRPVRDDQHTWNGQAIDAWASVHCSDGSVLDIAHDAYMRTSLAMLPMRTTGMRDLIAPLGTLWGSPVRHDVRHTGGHGAGDVITPVVGSQFRPAAPDWSGQQVSYRLLVSDGERLDTGTMTLFAHPPLVRVGAAPSDEVSDPED